MSGTGGAALVLIDGHLPLWYRVCAAFNPQALARQCILSPGEKTASSWRAMGLHRYNVAAPTYCHSALL
jgi:hypothetical protein